jgi:lipopolysaccharide/colanic/teichoic acid biosynthesis glycosyltransferase
MSIVGPRPWALYDALRINPKGQKRLNALPGITGPWQVEARSNLLELDAVNNYDLEYLDNWSLWKDLKILLLTIPKVLLAFGAY